EDGRSLQDITRRMEIVRLGQGVDRTGELDPEALQRTLAATQRYARLCQEHQVEALRFVATSATRDARNRSDFVDGVRRRLGGEVEVSSGDEEAALSYAGAVSILGEPIPPRAWWWTSAGDPPNWCWAMSRCAAPSPWTSDRCGSPS